MERMFFSCFLWKDIYFLCFFQISYEENDVGRINYENNECVRSDHFNIDQIDHIEIEKQTLPLDKNLTKNVCNKFIMKCSVCYLSFIKVSELVQHMTVHAGEQNFKCTICNKGFFKESCLRSHMRTHSDLNYSRHDYPFHKRYFLRNRFRRTQVDKQRCKSSVGDDPLQANCLNGIVRKNKEDNLQCPVCKKVFFSLFHKMLHKHTTVKNGT